MQKFDTDGKFITKWGTEGADDNQFQDPIVLPSIIYSLMYYPNNNINNR
jgi:hypothetical protein